MMEDRIAMLKHRRRRIVHTERKVVPVCFSSLHPKPLVSRDSSGSAIGMRWSFVRVGALQCRPISCPAHAALW